MTVSDIYTKCKLWMFDKVDSTTYDASIIAVVNKILAETYEENNMMRMFKGKVPFIDGISAHQVSALTDEVDYEDEYLYDVIPKGIDANLLMDDDLNKMSIYQTEYNNARVVRQVTLSSDKIAELTEEAESAN